MVLHSIELVVVSYEVVGMIYYVFVIPQDHFHVDLAYMLRMLLATFHDHGGDA
jgi:hypothetical protein